MTKNRVIFTSCCLGLLLTGCAFDVVHVKQIPTQLKSTSSNKSSWRLGNDINVILGTGYSRQLKSGTKWDYVGSITHGDVFKTDDQILTVEGSNIYEAYVVISSGKLVGFYLAVEHTFSPLSEPQEIEMKKIFSTQ